MARQERVQRQPEERPADPAASAPVETPSAPADLSYTDELLDEIDTLLHEEAGFALNYWQMGGE